MILVQIGRAEVESKSQLLFRATTSTSASNSTLSDIQFSSNLRE